MQENTKELPNNIEQLKSIIAQKDEDIKDIAGFILKITSVFGLACKADFETFSMPRLIAQLAPLAVRPHKLKAKFEFLKDAEPLFTKYEHVFNAAAEQIKK
jgi:hypothetical protein